VFLLAYFKRELTLWQAPFRSWLFIRIFLLHEKEESDKVHCLFNKYYIMKTVAHYIEDGFFKSCGESNRQLKTPMTSLLLAIDEEARTLFCEDQLSFYEKLMQSIPEVLAQTAEDTLDENSLSYT